MQLDAAQRVVLAPDKFKGTVSARHLVGVMAAAIAELSPTTVVSALPVADGGDGSVEAALSAGWRADTVPASDAWGDELVATVARLDDRAIVEVASICGLGSRQPTPDQAASATTRGVGRAVAVLLDQGVREITLALGGSVTTDGGAGLLEALGCELCDSAGQPLAPGGAALGTLARVRTTGLHPGLRDLRLVLAGDVDTPMVGPDGSAEMFARQKGADDDLIARLSAGLAHAAPLLEDAFGARGAALRPGSGAAGGLAWAGLLLGGQLRSGAGVFLDLLDAADTIRGADLVITGEGRLDAQSLRGKAPVSVARLAGAFGVPTVAIVGSNRLPLESTGTAPFAEVIALDRIDPACARDSGLTCRLVGQATRTLVEATLDLSTNTENGARP
ncbi:glycerate kinase [Streptomyces sp. TP-A0874]|uniref:glycerate kinase n=1 Tax=Streptomyces sp. TP-A0874 TaxID=549819 RepID=UPI0008537009|nr:glycerate kinase [Streptomyces sp. TP-A0874]